MNEKMYTLDEARAELQKQECRRRGHSWDIVETVEDGPVALKCVCGESRYVVASGTSRDVVVHVVCSCGECMSC